MQKVGLKILKNKLSGYIRLATADVVRLLTERRNEIDRFAADEEAGFFAPA